MGFSVVSSLAGGGEALMLKVEEGCGVWGCVRTLGCACLHAEVVNIWLAFLTNLVVMKRICLPSP